MFALTISFLIAGNRSQTERYPIASSLMEREMLQGSAVCDTFVAVLKNEMGL